MGAGASLAPSEAPCRPSRSDSAGRSRAPLGAAEQVVKLNMVGWGGRGGRGMHRVRLVTVQLRSTGAPRVRTYLCM
eukprot:7592521-Pyramimonas_sp.AAC.1